MPKIMLFTKADEKKLLANGAKSANGRHDPKPVVKLFNPTGAGMWLLTELDPEDPTRAFGLCDTGAGYPEIGYVSLAELRRFRGKFGVGIERDTSFSAEYTLSEYARFARDNGRVMA